MASGVGSPACHFTSCGILDVILKPGEHDERVSHGAEATGMARDRMCKTHSRRRRCPSPPFAQGEARPRAARAGCRGTRPSPATSACHAHPRPVSLPTSAHSACPEFVKDHREGCTSHQPCRDMGRVLTSSAASPSEQSAPCQHLGQGGYRGAVLATGGCLATSLASTRG